jgi:TPR repeat protein
MRRDRNSAVVLLTASLVAGCATRPPPSCAGLEPVRAIVTQAPDGTRTFTPIYPPGEDPIARLTCEADRGNAVAARALAERYEQGIGVAPDQARAAALYARAAAEVPAFTQVYAPPVTLGGAGSVLVLPNPAGTRGDAEAQYRLGRMYLEGRGVAQDQARAIRLFAMAANQQHPAAADALRLLHPS